MGLVLSEKNISHELDKVRSSRKIIFTNGCFDILHVGHIRYLKAAKSCGDILFVGVNSDASVKKLKGPSRPMQSQEDRAEILASLDAVSYVCVFEEDTPLELIKKVRPNVLAKGGDWRPDQIVGSDFVQSYGGRVESLLFVEGKSTTALIQKSIKSP